MKQNSSAIYVARGASYLFIQNIASTIIIITAFAIIARLITQAEGYHRHTNPSSRYLPAHRKPRLTKRCNKIDS